MHPDIHPGILAEEGAVVHSLAVLGVVDSLKGSQVDIPGILLQGTVVEQQVGVGTEIGVDQLDGNQEVGLLALLGLVEGKILGDSQQGTVVDQAFHMEDLGVEDHLLLELGAVCMCHMGPMQGH